METNDKDGARPQPITQELVIAKITPDLTRLNYQAILQGIENINVAKDNLPESYEKIKKAGELWKELENKRVEEKSPFDKQVEAIQKAFKSVMNPLEEIIKRKRVDVATIKAQVDKENREIEEANQKKIAAQQASTKFINDTIKAISEAITDTEISRIQMAIGTQKSRTAFYGDQMEAFKIACDNLNPQINDRKEYIRKEAILKKEEQDALESGDIQKITDLKEEREVLQQEMKENVLRMQETAFNESSNIEVVLTESTLVSVDGRNYWRWEVKDLKLLAKKMPELIEVIPNKKAIDLLLSTKRKDGTLKGKREENYFGIRFFIQENF